MCVVWDLNGDAGATGPRGGKYEAHSECRFIQPAGTLFATERLFFFLWVGAAETTCISACQSVTYQKSNYRTVFMIFYIAT